MYRFRNDLQGTLGFISRGGELLDQNTFKFLKDNGASDKMELFFPAPCQYF